MAALGSFEMAETLATFNAEFVLFNFSLTILARLS
jgi:hypothetical protein